MLVLSLVMLFVCIVMPLGFAWSLWRADEASLAGWLVTAAYAATLVFLVMAVGRWDIAGDYLRWAVLAMFVLALVLSFFRHRHRPLRAPDGRPYGAAIGQQFCRWWYFWRAQSMSGSG